MLELLEVIFKPIGSAVQMYIVMGAISKLVSTFLLFMFLVALFIRFAF